MAKSKIRKILNEYFNFNGDANLTYCNICNKSFKSFIAGNLKRHIIRCHHVIATNLELIDHQENEPKFNLTTQAFAKAYLKLTTDHGFRLIDSSSFKIIRDPICQALEIVNFDRGYITEKIGEAAQKIRQQICDGIKKMVSLKIDIAKTAQEGCILSINVQFINEANLQILITFEKEIKVLLQKYGINLSQIYSCIIDNGARRIKTIEHKNDPQTVVANDTNPDGSFLEENNLTDFLEDEAEEYMNMVIENLNTNLSSFRCATHTFQLIANGMVIKYISHIKTMDTNYSMKNLHDNRALYQDLEQCDMDEHQWKFVQEFVEAFGSLYNTTQKLEREQLMIGDFMKLWLEWMMTLMSSRLFENDAFRAATFIDPRFNFMRSPFIKDDEKEGAMKFLVNLWKSLQGSKQPQIAMNQGNRSKLDLFMENECGTASILSEIKLEKDFKLKLSELSNQTIIPVDTNILEYWYSKRFEDPELYELSHIVLATPASQLNVEDDSWNS
ncbi:unnamed protein product [Gordionus sp. m RMFG-2023]